MIAADTSTWISFFGGEQGDDVLALARALQSHQVVMPPPVLTELLSDPELSASVAQTLLELPLVALKDGFWQRAGRLRAKALEQNPSNSAHCEVAEGGFSLGKKPLDGQATGYIYSDSAVARKRKARLGDALIAQCCMDADIALITRDRDFKAFSAGLNLL